VRRALFVLVVAGGGTLALVLVLAVAVGRCIAGSLTDLTGLANSLGSGEQPAPSRTGINEADLIAEVLCSTGKDLNRRTVELTQTVEALRHSEKQHRNLSEDLRRALDERGELLNRIVSAQESERQRIARELHDHLGQYFAAMLLGLNAADKASSWHDEGRHRIADLKSMTSVVSREVHELSWELRQADRTRRSRSRSRDRQLPREMEWALQSERGLRRKSSREAAIRARRDHTLSCAARGDDQHRKACASRKNQRHSGGRNRRGTPHSGR
jgi:signal transduction histidine kinase